MPGACGQCDVLAAWTPQPEAVLDRKAIPHGDFVGGPGAVHQFIADEVLGSIPTQTKETGPFVSFATWPVIEYR